MEYNKMYCINNVKYTFGVYMLHTSPYNMSEVGDSFVPCCSPLRTLLITYLHLA